MDDLWLPDSATKKRKGPKYKVSCRCGNEMRVRPRHFGRMCRCTKCQFPIYVTYDNVTPRVSPHSKGLPRFFSQDEVPVHWKKGDLFMEMYEVRGILGKGGMGVVYRVYHRGWGTMIAVKCPKATLLPDEEWIEIFEQECETWINLPSHPNTVECYYVRRLGGIPRVFIEYVRGDDLGRSVSDKRLYHGGHQEALLRILDVAIQFAWGLHHAHSQGVIHQDVKPTNVILGEDGVAKVTDFGLARAFEIHGTETPSGTSDSPRSPRGGTPVYRSPDHRTKAPITLRTDIWSWGVSMIELFAGEVFWESGHEARKVLADLLKTGARYDEVPPMPDSVSDLLTWCFERQPDNRPKDMLEVAEVLKGIYQETAGMPFDRPDPGSRADTSDNLNNRAVSLLDLGKSDDSETLWRQILEADPHHLEAVYNYNLHFWRTGRLTDAEMVVRIYEACEESPRDWVAPYLLARVLMERGESRTAIRVLEGITNSEEYRREVAFALAMAQNLADNDKRLLWESTDSATATAVAVSFDGWRAITGELDGRVRMWEVSSGKCAATMVGHKDRVNAVILSEQEATVLSASSDGTVRTWDPVSGRPLKTMSGHDKPVVCASLSADAKKAVSGGVDGTLKVWNVSSGECIRTFKGHEGKVNSVAISRDGEFVLSGGADCNVKFWELATGKCVQNFEGSYNEVRSVALSFDRSVAFTTSGRKIKVWNLKEGELRRSFKGHRSEIDSICPNESGRYALSATRKGTIKIWDVESGQCLRSLKGHAPSALSRDGRLAISTGPKGEFKIWAVNMDESPFASPFIICRQEDSLDGDRPSL